MSPTPPGTRPSPTAPARPGPTRPAATRPGPWRRDARFWAVELIPQYLLGVATLVFAATKWNAVRSAAESMQAVALNTAVALGWLVLSLVVMPLVVRKQSVRVVILTVAAAVLAWVLFANAYRDQTVVETLKGLDAPTATTPRGSIPAGAPTSTDSNPAAASPPGGPAPTIPPTVAGPVRLRSAALRGIDHRASGTASIIRQPDGAFVVGLEDIDIEPGPDYRVYIVPGSTERTSDGAVELDALRGNQGTQFYDVPRGVNVGDGQWTVLIWCKRFAVPIANAVPV